MWPHNLYLYLFTFLLCSLLCHSVEVHNAKELIELFKNEKGNSLKSDIELLDDLDFSGSGITYPLGVDSDGKCTAYSGTFQGNGHLIKGLVMNNKNGNVFSSSGLFCSLKDVIFENLIIDSSCSFTGYYVGGLSVTAAGSVSCFNVTNMATISGSYRTGGLIGYIEGMKQNTIIVFEDCLNHGAVSGTSSVGGFIGYIYNNMNMDLSLTNCTNSGKITVSDDDVGGFLGYIESNTNITMTLSNCTNRGSVNSGDDYTGGFVGYLKSNTQMNVQSTFL